MICRKTSLWALPMLAILAIGCGGSSTELTWAQWRGPNGLGISDAIDVPLYWNRDGAGIKWSAPIEGTGTSSPIVAGDRVYVTSATAAQVGQEVELRLASFDLDSGKKLWQTIVIQRPRERMHLINSSAGPTPVTDGRHVFAYFGSHLAALDTRGKTVWVKEIDPEYLEEARYAAGSSLILYDDMVVVLRDRERVGDELEGWIAAFDKATGETVWKKKTGPSCCSYVTPLVIDGAEGRELFVVLAGYVSSYDPQTGKRLWRKKQAIAQPVSSPVTEGDLLCVASGAHGHRQARCWEKSVENGAVEWKGLWKYAKWVPDTSSPVLLDGRLFLLTEKGILRAIDARTGRLVWQKRLERSGYRASLVAAGGNLYAVAQTGTVSVVNPAEGETLAINSMPEESYVASPAVAGGCLLVRSDSHLYCIEGTDAATVSAGSGVPVPEESAK